MTFALYRQWRPQTWDEIVGQDHVVQTLRHAVRAGHLAHAYLFSGPRGTGKTTTARVLAKAVNCLAQDPADRPCNACHRCRAIQDGRFLDLIEIDAASNTSVEDVRRLRDKINFRPHEEGARKIYIVDEVHMLSTAAFNALLKTLEEPPPHAIFVLATTEPHKVPATVLSRCQRHEFRRLPVRTIAGYLQQRVEQAAIAAEAEALELIARQSTGSLRDAISLLDQLAATGEPVTLTFAREVLGAVADEAVGEVVDALAAGDVGRGLASIRQALDRGADARQFARQMVDYLRDLLMVQMGNAALIDLRAESLPRLEAQARAMPSDRLLAGMQSFTRAALDTRAAWQPNLPLEFALIESASRPAALPAAADNPPDRPEGRAREGKPSAAPAAPAEGKGRGAKPPAAPPAPPEGRGREAKPAPAARPEPSAGSRDEARSQGEITLDLVLGRWSEILQSAYRHDPVAQALLNSGKPVGVASGALVLGFRSDLLREKMEKRHNLTVARQALQEVLGTPVELRCVVVDRWSPAGEGSAPAQEGGMVSTAVRELGGQVVDVKHVPPESGSA